MKLLTIISIILLFPAFTMAATGDTTHVVSHNAVYVNTDPSDGSNEFTAWAVFPAAGTSYRKVYVTMRYECPPGQLCGEWDYIDAIYLRRTGSVDSSSHDIEMVRYITPYGNGFNSSWNFTWHADITDFSFLLHDSVEIGYVHTGWETNSRGWMVTLDFHVIEGTPVNEVLAIHPLWEGSFPYGNASDPIESHLTPVAVTMSPQTEAARVKITHTGHGFDSQNCSEFCSKYRDLYIDSVLVQRYTRWRTCGGNALYPQGGTWLYNRANWCPGAVVFPENVDFITQPSGTHTIDVNMQPYVNATPSGNEYLFAYLFEMRNPVHQNDASIEELIEPSTINEYMRTNPVCSNPKLIIRNNGSDTLTTLNIQYGFQGTAPATYAWTGSLATMQTDTVTLSGVSLLSSASNELIIYTENPNGISDGYPYDDTAKAVIAPAPVLDDSTMVLQFLTNNEPNENSYELTDDAGNVIYSRAFNTMLASTVYRDTFHLTPGVCYTLMFNDNDPFGDDGLAFWANPNAGNGYIQIKKISGTLIRTYPGDFGSFVRFNFSVDPLLTGIKTVESQRSLHVYPNPSNGKFRIDFGSTVNESAIVTITDAMGRSAGEFQTVSTGEIIEADLTGLGAGLYFVSVSGKDFRIDRKIMIQ